MCASRLGIELPQNDESYGAGYFLENSKKQVKIIIWIQEPRSAMHESNFTVEPMAKKAHPDAWRRWSREHSKACQDVEWENAPSLRRENAFNPHLQKGSLH